MTGLRSVLLTAALCGALLGLWHEYRWFDPPDASIGFWESVAAGGLIWGAVFGACVGLAAVWAANRIGSAGGWGPRRVPVVGTTFALAFLVLAAVGWHYSAGAQGRRVSDRITGFQADFAAPATADDLAGSAPDALKQAVLDWYEVAGKLATAELVTSAPAVLAASAPSHARVLGGILAGERPSEWSRLSWGDPERPCRGPFAEPVSFRVAAVDEVAGSLSFAPWHPGRGGVFTRTVRLPEGHADFAAMRVTRQIGMRATAADGTVSYRYACPRSEDAAAAVAMVLCRNGDGWRVCAQTDTAGLWITYPYEALGDTRPTAVAVDELARAEGIQIAFGGRHLWLLDGGGSRLLQLGADGAVVGERGLGVRSARLAAAAGSVWVGTDGAGVLQVPGIAAPLIRHDTAGTTLALAPAPDGVWSISQAAGKRTAGKVTANGYTPLLELVSVPSGIIGIGDRAWVYGPGGLLAVPTVGGSTSAATAATAAPVLSRALTGPAAAAHGALWMPGSAPGYVVRIDPADASQLEFAVAGQIAGIATAADVLWVGDAELRQIVRVDGAGSVTGRWPVDIEPQQITYGGGALWVADPEATGRVLRLPLALP